MKTLYKSIALLFIFSMGMGTVLADHHKSLWNDYKGKAGPGKGKKIVLVSGDEEYRSEEALPLLGKILTKHHGFDCRVVYAIDADTGYVNPNNRGNIPGLEALKDADLMIIATRFRTLKDEQMQHIDDYLKRGGPVVGMRTATHAFNFNGKSKWHHYSNGYGGPKKGWKGGFGGSILGDFWKNHHGRHGGESTRGIIHKDFKDHPITRGITEGSIWGPSDVYGVRLPLPKDTKTIIMGQVLKGMKKDDPPSERGNVNSPMMPLGWTKSYQTPDGKKGKVFTTTLGASTDLVAEGSRRMIVNAVYHLLGMEVPKSGTKVDIVGKFKPTKFSFKPKDYWPKLKIRPSQNKMD